MTTSGRRREDAAQETPHDSTTVARRIHGLRVRSLIGIVCSPAVHQCLCVACPSLDLGTERHVESEASHELGGARAGGRFEVDRRSSRRKHRLGGDRFDRQPHPADDVVAFLRCTGVDDGREELLERRRRLADRRRTADATFAVPCSCTLTFPCPSNGLMMLALTLGPGSAIGALRTVAPRTVAPTTSSATKIHFRIA